MERGLDFCFFESLKDAVLIDDSGRLKRVSSEN